MTHQRSRKPNPFDRRAAHRAQRNQHRREMSRETAQARHEDDQQDTRRRLHAHEATEPENAEQKNTAVKASGNPRYAHSAHAASRNTSSDNGAPAQDMHDIDARQDMDARKSAVHNHDTQHEMPQAAPQDRQPANGRATQYFADAPTTEDVRRTLTVTLRGRDVAMEASNGVFSADRLDLGTRVLLKHAPQPPAHGTFLDLGCGWGPISVALALESPHADVWAVDVNERALDLTRTNAERNGCANVHVAAADAVPADLRFDLIWSNPPIRIGKDALHDLLMTWLVRLAVGGRAYLVVQRNLGADSLIPWLQQALDERCGDQSFVVSKDASSKGYRVIAIVRTR